MVLGPKFTLHSPHTTCLENAPTRAGGRSRWNTPKSLSHTVSTLLVDFSNAVARCDAMDAGWGAAKGWLQGLRGQGMRRARQQQSSSDNTATYLQQDRRLRKVRGKTLRSENIDIKKGRQ